MSLSNSAFAEFDKFDSLTTVKKLSCATNGLSELKMSELSTSTDDVEEFILSLCWDKERLSAVFFNTESLDLHVRIGNCRVLSFNLKVFVNYRS